MLVKKFIPLLVTAALVQTATVGYSAVLNAVSVDTQNSIVTVNGQLPVKKAGQLVGVEIFSGGVTRETIINATDAELSEMLVFIGQTVTNEDGSYSISFKQSGNSGDYVARIGYGKANKSREKLYGYFNVDDIGTTLATINGTDVAGDVVDLLNSYGEYIGVDTNKYNKLSDSDKENAAEAVLKARGTGFENIGAFIDTLDRAIVMQLVNEAGTSDAVLGYIENNPDTFNGMSAYKAWERLDDEAKNTVADKLFMDDEYSDIKSFYDNCGLYIISQAIYNVGSYGEIEDIIEENAVFLELDTDDYDKLGSNRSYVWKALAGELYTSKADINKAFEDAVYDAKPKKTGTGGGGGGGGSSSGGVAVIPKAEPQKTEAEKVSTEEKQLFSDLGNTLWAKESIEYLYNAGIVSGDGSGSFRPGDNVTRAEFVTMITKAFSLANSAVSVDFEDVKENDWFASAVAGAVSAGIVSGVDEKSFAPYENLTREQMAAIAYRLALYTGIDLYDGQAEEFSDEANISSYAKDAVRCMQKAGIINGQGDGSFNPKGLTTRAAASVVIHKLLTGGGN